MTELEKALARIGASIVRVTEKQEEKRTTLLLRVAEDKGEQWVAAFSLFMLRSTEDRAWRLDVSKYFFVHKGDLRYFWRLIVTGEVAGALDLFTRIAIESAAQPRVELTSYPLVGRAEYVRDPARGLLKGAHDTNGQGAMPGYVAAHFVR